jgi:hypothetical protein
MIKTFAEEALDRAQKVLPLLQPDMASYHVAKDSVELSARLSWIIFEMRAIASTFVMKETQLQLAKVMFDLCRKLETPERAIDEQSNANLLT